MGGARTFAGSAVIPLDRKSTRLNSSHSQISYAVFCLKKKSVVVAGKLDEPSPRYPFCKIASTCDGKDIPGSMEDEGGYPDRRKYLRDVVLRDVLHSRA